MVFFYQFCSMKKILTIILVSYYVGLSALNIISIHYCHDQLKSVSFVENFDSCCGTQTAKKAPCCEDIQIVVDFKIDHIYSQAIQIVYFESPLALFENYSEHVLSITENETIRFEEFPPGSQIHKLFKTHNAFLFYG